MSIEEQLSELRLSYSYQGQLEDENDKSKDKLFRLMLKRAKYIALGLLYPYDLNKTELPNRIKEDWQIRCAEELINRLGDENVQSYSENSLSISYFTSLLSNDLKSELTPAKVGLPISNLRKGGSIE